MKNWKEDIFNNFTKLNRGFDLPNQSIIDGEYPIVASTAIKDYHKFYKVEPPCVVTGRSGSLGAVQYINECCWPLNTALYVKNFKGNFPKFVYYFLKTMHLENFNTGAGVPTLNQNHLHNLKIKYPIYDLQKKIAAVLSAYDDLIENNNRRIAILEKMAEEIYKEWFVRMRFPNHENTEFVKGVPEGWKVKKIGDIIEPENIRTGKRPKGGSELSGIPSIGAENVIGIGRYNFLKEKYVNEQFFNSMNQGHIQDKDILFYKDGADIGRVSLFQDNFPHKKCCVNEHVFLLRTKETFFQYFLYFYFSNQSIKDFIMLLNKNAAQPGINKKEIQSIPIIIPTNNLIDSFNNSISQNITYIFNLANMNIKLKQTRDRLLPRLISGKLSVEELNIKFPKSMEKN